MQVLVLRGDGALRVVHRQTLTQDVLLQVGAGPQLSIKQRRGGVVGQYNTIHFRVWLDIFIPTPSHDMWHDCLSANCIWVSKHT